MQLLTVAGHEDLVLSPDFLHAPAWLPPAQAAPISSRLPFPDASPLSTRVSTVSAPRLQGVRSRTLAADAAGDEQLLSIAPLIWSPIATGRGGPVRRRSCFPFGIGSDGTDPSPPRILSSLLFLP
jgi:hypothetical protein